jgi:putative flavoprotein involved in K+ transport
MMQTTAVVIGADHAGLAMSRRLTERSIDHVVLERGAVANSWRSQRWPSLRLLTPNWLTRLPGYDYAGDDPDGYMPAAGVVSTLTRYARLAAAPVRTEIHRSGRPVTLAVGEHVRLPRRYRGRDIFWWLEATGVLGERYDQIDDLTRARHLPSPQLTGTPKPAATDLNTLTAQGVRIVGRLGRITGGSAQFSVSLRNTCTLADLKMNRFLARADNWAHAPPGTGEPPRQIRPLQFGSLGLGDR